MPVVSLILNCPSVLKCDWNDIGSNYRKLQKARKIAVPMEALATEGCKITKLYSYLLLVGVHPAQFRHS